MRTKKDYLALFDKLDVKANSDIYNRFFLKHYEIEFSNKTGKEISLCQTEKSTVACFDFLSHLKKPLNEHTTEELVKECEDYELYINSRKKIKVTKSGDKVIKKELNQKLSKKTVKAMISSIKTFLGFCCDDDLIAENFLAKLKKKHIFQISSVDKPRYNHLTDISLKDRDAIVFSQSRKPFEFSWLSLLRECGMRISELRNLRVGMVSFLDPQPYAEITLIGKTGKRIVPILTSVNPLRKWLQQHPEKNNPNAFVFPKCVYDRNNHKRIFKCDERITIAYFAQRLKKIAEQLGINSHIRPHLFRHLKALEMKNNNLTEPVANELMGWSMGSKQYSMYGSGNPETKVNAVFALAGINREQKKELTQQFKVCENCHTINDAGRNYCQTCSLELEFAKPKSEIPEIKAMIDRMDKLEQLNQYALTMANKKINEMNETQYKKMLVEVEAKHGLRAK